MVGLQTERSAQTTDVFACFQTINYKQTINCILNIAVNDLPKHAIGFQIDFLPYRLPLIFISASYKNQLKNR